MNTISSSPEVSNQVSLVVDKLNKLRDDLINVFENFSFDKVTEYGMKTIQGVFTWVKSLFVDVIIIKLNQVSVLVKELKNIWLRDGLQTSHINSLIELQKAQMTIKMDRHSFFRENFSRRVTEIFA